MSFLENGMQQRRNRFLQVLIGLAFVLMFNEGLFAEDSAGIEYFEAKIRPILIKHCYGCHSEESKKSEGGLLLDSRLGISKGGDSGLAIVPKKPSESLLLSSLKHTDLKMPPEKKLSEGIIQDFERWIQMGAQVPQKGKTQSAKPDDWPQRLNHWSFQPIQRSEIPADNSGWSRSAIDSFVSAGWIKQKLTPVADASRETLLRRLSFDLIGLPPTIAEQDEFISDSSPEAVLRLVDRLLDSPHFGERWGRHWLDLARFSETNGGDRNVIHRHAWRYRDYVISAFNDDKPFNQFVREQVAGDLLESKSQHEHDEQLVATGFLTLGRKLFMQTNSEQFRMDRVDEQINVVTRSVLGLTVSCARCHDHKFDPIPTRDYYALAGIFRSTFLLYGAAAPAGNQYGHDRPLQPIGQDAEKLNGPAKAWKKKVAEKTAARNKARSDRYRVVRDKAAQENKLKMLESKKGSAEEIKKFKKEIAELDVVIKDWDKKIEEHDAQLKEITENPPPFPDYCMAIRDEEKVENCKICIRGQISERGDLVPRGFLSDINFGEEVEIPADQSGRKQLADWLVHSKNPLTARVAVNRVWQHLFGEGLVRSVDNFGTTGEDPSHPELLDYLATEFQRDGWSPKRLIRRIVLSRVYQLESIYQSENNQLDPDNRFLWRQNARRLEVEPLRDSILAVSGQLDRNRPESSPIAGMKDRELNSTVRLSVEQLDLVQRTIYLPIARFHLPEVLETFDFADPTMVVGKRNARTMASQQLFFLNSPWLFKKSTEAAKRLLGQPELTNSDRMVLAFRRFNGRHPAADELAVLLEYLEAGSIETAVSDDSKKKNTTVEKLVLWQRICQAIFAGAEFRTVQ